MRRPFLMPMGLIAVLLPLAAQPQKTAAATAAPAAPVAALRPSASQRVFVLKYADPGQMADLVRGLGASVTVNTEAHAVAVVSAFPEVISAIDDAIQRLDVPAAAQNIEVTAYYLIGGSTDSALGNAMPKELASVATELTTSSNFKNYRVLDVLTIRLRAGQGASTSGAAGTVGTGSPTITTDFRIRSATVTADGTAVRIDRLSAAVKMPVAAGGNQYTSSDLSINADVDLKPEERVVVGRVGMNRNQALFVVLMAKVIK